MVRRLSKEVLMQRPSVRQERPQIKHMAFETLLQQVYYLVLLILQRWRVRHLASVQRAVPALLRNKRAQAQPTPKIKYSNQKFNCSRACFVVNSRGHSGTAASLPPCCGASEASSNLSDPFQSKPCSCQRFILQPPPLPLSLTETLYKSRYATVNACSTSKGF